MNWMKDIKALIFDMDGTLYQDYTFMGRYIGKMMAGRLSQEETEKTIARAYSILDGSGPVRLGYLYDPERRVFYRQEELQPVSCCDWDGTALDLEADPGQALTYLGDPWTIAQLMAHHHGVPVEEGRVAFEEVRKEMLTEAYRIVKHAGLFDAIGKLRDKRLLLMTNSPLPTGREFVDFLGAEQVFDEIHYDGKKPAGISALVEGLLADGFAPHEILSIGDHPWNDLHPVRRAGGHTCLISGHQHDDATPWSASVASVDELAAFLEELHAQAEATREEEAYG